MSRNLSRRVQFSHPADRPVIYYIGGASGAGKSTVASRLAAYYGFEHIELDKIFVSVGQWVEDPDLRSSLTDSQSILVADWLLRLNAGCILEGGWINPAQAQKLIDKYGDRFCPVYCGFKGDSAELHHRYALTSAHSQHWLIRESRSEAYAWLERQVVGSLWYESECLEFGFPFFDFSDFNAGSSRLESHFRDLMLAGGSAAGSMPWAPSFRHQPRGWLRRYVSQKRVLAAAAIAGLLVGILIPDPTLIIKQLSHFAQWLEQRIN